MDCILHKGFLDKDGYGRVWRGYKSYLAHRYAIDAPDGMEVHHLCGTRACINVEHLIVLTKKQHGVAHRKQVCHKGHQKVLRKDKMTCLPCENEASKRYKARQPA